MSVPFDFFFGILGLVTGMVIVWLLESRHAFEANEEPWTLPDPVEPSFIAAELAKRGRPVDEETVTEILDLHLAYLDGRVTEEQRRTDRELVAKARRAATAEAAADAEANAAADAATTRDGEGANAADAIGTTQPDGAAPRPLEPDAPAADRTAGEQAEPAEARASEPSARP